MMEMGFTDRVVSVIERQSRPSLDATLREFEPADRARVKRVWERWLVESSE